jgi:uncharacterized protein (TIGR02996 family)
MSDESALLNAILAHPDEDTPRLAYADWLEENGQPDRAEFIRVHCRYSAASPTQREYPDLQEGLWFTRARCAAWLKANRPELPNGFDHASPTESEDYRRGFSHAVRGAWHNAHRDPTDDEVEDVCAGLKALVTTTTVRFLLLSRVSVPQLARVAAAPGAEKLAGLALGPSWQAQGDEVVQVLTADSLRGLQHLFLNFTLTSEGTRALARCEFDRLEYLDLPALDCDRAALDELVGAKWFRSLMQVRTDGSAPAVIGPLLAALAQMPRLEHLGLEVRHPPTASTFPGPDGFRELAQLFMWGDHVNRAVDWLAKAQMPKLIEFLVRGLKNGGFRALRTARWFHQLWMLDFSQGRITDRSIVALTKSPLRELRVLNLSDNSFGRTGLRALADGSRLPNLTTLNLNSALRHPIPAADVVEFAAALNRPPLRNLGLDFWPLGNEGARALAKNPALANLTRLSVNSCGIGDAGLRALARSRHLQGLVQLDIMGNQLRKATALFDPALLPRLGRVRIRNNQLTSTSAAKLARSRNWSVELADE